MKVYKYTFGKVIPKDTNFFYTYGESFSKVCLHNYGKAYQKACFYTFIKPFLEVYFL